MGGIANDGMYASVVLMLCCFVAGDPALAAPPGMRSAASSPVSSPPGSLQSDLRAGRLDLRLPADRDFPPPSSEKSAASAFGAALPGWRNESRAGSFNALVLESPGSDQAHDGRARELSRAEIFARRFRREGLPLAKLWDGHSAMISLGLNPHGKPGLWLVQKTR